jgi:hypothetical protein
MKCVTLSGVLHRDLHRALDARAKAEGMPTVMLLNALVAQALGIDAPTLLLPPRRRAKPLATANAAGFSPQERMVYWLQQMRCSSERHIYRGLHLSAADCVATVDALAAAGAVVVVPGRPRMVHLAGCACLATAGKATADAAPQPPPVA